MRDRGRFHSADTIGGWRNHYFRMRRWKLRAERLASVGDDENVDPKDAVDFALAYFIWAHSLREWLVNDGAIAERDLDEALLRQPQWAMCRDLANRSRHFDLTRKPTDKYWSLKRSYDPFSEQLRGSGEYHWIVFFDKKNIRLGQAIQNISEMWDEVLASLGLGPPDNLAIYD